MGNAYLDRFGPFAKVFPSGELRVPGHLPLLAFDGEEVPAVLDRISRALLEADAQGYVDAMFDDPNWRPHLVAACALLLDHGETLRPDHLWWAVDGGSWVTPQLVVTAHLVDRDFPARAQERLAGGCVIREPNGLSPAERHSATGPSGHHGRVAKLAASLLTVASLHAALAHFAELPESAGIRAMAATDRENSASIATRWLAAVTIAFEKRAVHLAPAST